MKVFASELAELETVPEHPPPPPRTTSVNGQLVLHTPEVWQQASNAMLQCRLRRVKAIGVVGAVHAVKRRLV